MTAIHANCGESGEAGEDGEKVLSVHIDRAKMGVGGRCCPHVVRPYWTGGVLCIWSCGTVAGQNDGQPRLNYGCGGTTFGGYGATPSWWLASIGPRSVLSVGLMSANCVFSTRSYRHL